MLIFSNSKQEMCLLINLINFIFENEIIINKVNNFINKNNKNQIYSNKLTKTNFKYSLDLIKFNYFLLIEYFYILQFNNNFITICYDFTNGILLINFVC